MLTLTLPPLPWAAVQAMKIPILGSISVVGQVCSTFEQAQKRMTISAYVGVSAGKIASGGVRFEHKIQRSSSGCNAITDAIYIQGRFFTITDEVRIWQKIGSVGGDCTWESAQNKPPQCYYDPEEYGGYGPRTTCDKYLRAKPENLNCWPCSTSNTEWELPSCKAFCDKWGCSCEGDY